jgi:hypothetical protein
MWKALSKQILIEKIDFLRHTVHLSQLPETSTES